MLETKARTNHRPKDNITSELATCLPVEALRKDKYNTLVVGSLGFEPIPSGDVSRKIPLGYFIEKAF